MFVTAPIGFLNPLLGICFVDHLSEHLRRMIAWIHIGIHASHFAGFVDKDADAARIAGFGIGTRTIGDAESTASIAQDGKIEGVFGGKRGVLINGVEAGADDRDVVLVEKIFLIAEPATLNGSSGGVGLREKPQNHFVTAQVFERQRFTFMGRKVEIDPNLA